MSFVLNASNSLEALSMRLSQTLKAQHAGVFKPYYIVTQTPGMNNWLNSQLATSLGIAANIRFIKPNDLITQVFRGLGSSQNGVLGSENLTWILFRLLSTSAFTARFQDVAQYYTSQVQTLNSKNSSQPRSNSDVKRMALAEKLADLFDQYQIYRPGMIEEWNHAGVHSIGPDEWQKYLWIKAKQEAQDDLPDRSVIRTYILSALKSEQQLQKVYERFGQIHVFGTSIITSYHLEILNALSQGLDIRFYILNPAPTVFWFEDKSEKLLAIWMRKGYNVEKLESGNPLLSSWGRLISDSFSLLFDYEEMLNSYEEVSPKEPQAHNLLSKLQWDIYTNSAKPARLAIAKEDLSDDSLVINSCHTLSREVEVLYNYLVHLVSARQEQLSPRDIVVMVTDIDQYAPYIRAVFDNAPYKFNYNIADESYTASDTVIHALEAILRINEDNFTAEKVLELLDSTYIRSRFAITDLVRLRRAVSLSGIRFGIAGEELNDTRFVSWDYGLTRIVYGVCMIGDETDEHDSFPENDARTYPLDLAEGNEAHEILRFAHFVRVLIDSVHERNEERTIPEWLVYLRSLIHNLIFDNTASGDEDLNLLEIQLNRIAVASDEAPEKLGFQVFKMHLFHAVSGLARFSLFAVKGLTFCSLIPMRSIPFKVVAVLGLNFDMFPRKDSPASFNLMLDDRRKGDRNIKENDKHLFLETLLSAQRYLYLSYIGQSTKDNSAIPPSALVDELVDYIRDGCAANTFNRSQFITAHKLHSYSGSYNQGDRRLYDYLQNTGDQTAAPVLEVEVVPVTGESSAGQTVKKLSLEALIRFFKNPIKGYYNNVLGLYYEDSQVLLRDTESFELDALEAWSLKMKLLTLDTAGASSLKEHLLRTGFFPLKSMAEVQLRQIQKVVEPVRLLLHEFVTGKTAKSINLLLSIDQFIVEARIAELYDTRLAIVSFSKNETKYLLEATLKYLFLRGAGYDVQACFISSKNNKAFYATAISITAAKELFIDYLKLYETGNEVILSFYPDLEITRDLLYAEGQEARNKLCSVIDKFRERLADQEVQTARSTYFLNEEAILYTGSRNAMDKFIHEAKSIMGPVMHDIFPTYYE